MHGGGGGEVKFLTEIIFFAKKCSWGLETQKKKKFGRGGGAKNFKVFFPY